MGKTIINNRLEQIQAMTSENLHSLINRYFEGDTTTSEEELLKQALTDDRFCNDELANEALAVLSYSAVSAPYCKNDTERYLRQESKTRLKTSKTRLIIRYVAAACIATALIIPVWHRLTMNPGECTAYVNGIRIDDDDIVTSLMISQLSDAAQASTQIEADINSDLSQIATAFNEIK